MTATDQIIVLHHDDDVAIAVADLPQGTALPGGAVSAAPVPRGHKIALRAVARGQPLRRYGQIIGEATVDIAPGAHVHSHNLGMGAHHQDYGFGEASVAVPAASQTRQFNGFARADGKVGTRNYIGVLTSVNCSGTVARHIAEQAEREGWLLEMRNVDGVVPIVHGTGCGMDLKGEGYATLFRTLSGYARNPNFGGILLVGLGCEMMQIRDLVGEGRLRPDGNFRYMTIQQSGGTRASVERGVAELRALAEVANRAERTRVPARHLSVALQCGGSDGYSGITANPALGIASDMIVAQGGITILAETPEIYGAEHLLTRRAVDAETGQNLVDHIAWWEGYTARNGGEMDNNPSPGNKAGGLTTILEKSLGAVAKGGSAPLEGVHPFGQVIDAPGFHFMNSPGYDPVSVTGQIASGATVVCFTTGRGSVSGFKPSPCLKLATNSEMFARMEPDMDINCGDVLSGVSLREKGEEIFERILSVASGERTKSEEQGFGGVEFVPWQLGAVM